MISITIIITIILFNYNYNYNYNHNYNYNYNYRTLSTPLHVDSGGVADRLPSCLVTTTLDLLPELSDYH